MIWRTIVLDDQAIDLANLAEQVDGLLAEAGARHGLRFVYEGQRGDPRGVTIDYWSAQPAGAIQLAVDRVLGIPYLSMNLAPDDLARIESDLAERFATLSIEEIKVAVRARRGDVRASLFRLALSLREFDTESYDLMREALSSADPATRNGAARGAVILRWSELLDPLEDARATETDAETARILDLAIRASSPQGA